MRGQIKIWDIRSPTEDPSRTFVLSAEQVSKLYSFLLFVQPNVLLLKVGYLAENVVCVYFFDRWMEGCKFYFQRRSSTNNEYERERTELFAFTGFTPCLNELPLN